MSSSRDIAKKSIMYHKRLKGTILLGQKSRRLSIKEIQMIYTPGVAAVSKEVFDHPEKKFVLTSKRNNVAIVTDGTRILGLGNIGPYAAMPVMEGKAMLYKQYARITAFPICLSTTDKKKIIETIIAIEPSFGAINLEDIESPKVLDISQELQKKIPVPVFHDDRHGTSVVALAALLNALKLVKKQLESVKIIVAGAGSAGVGITEILVFAGCKNVIVSDSTGAIYKGRRKNMNQYKNEIAAHTNPKREKGSLEDVIKNADVFIGVSGISNLITKDTVKKMKKDAIVFALTNPEPEIDPVIAKKAGARIVATGSYQFHNRVNNALVFPYIMRAILDHGISKIETEILYAVAVAISNTIPKKQLRYDNIISNVGDLRLQQNISRALKKFYKK
ncbi:NAD(P)-dependent malic enzyme [Candidatus Nitrosotalea okcheonensis]|uniref:Putative NAD-dependent malic enzyme 4 n=1 Tax=Candidatus Nitrosotalea okcheonensis TaxID=1903276 RepID=A0A2H1FCE3_9ARCH|nr:malic enzyme-like NAD(P)-binding protein [Candidatus Nitrosotalea okcheonensis]SMH70436.1 putative NAD-dependent malic enzyme 4 [Candidatus Nitrosotalea okcheonensis]